MTVRIIQKDTFDVIRSAVNKTVDFIKPTYGPASNKVIISKMTHKMVVDDGVQIARDLELSDPAENAVLGIVRETAIKTNDRVGDGTTGALIMVQAIIEEVAKISHREGRAIEKELKEGFADAKKQLLKSAKQITTKEDLIKVAKVSFDDQKIAETIAGTWFKLGKEGVLTVDRSGTMETFAEIADGIKLDRGFTSPYMVTNPQRMEAVIEKPYVLITDYRLTEANDVLPIMNLLSAKQITSLVIIAENVETNALATLIVNRMQRKFMTIAINAPGGEDRTNILEDIALMTGAKVFSEKKGDRLETATIADLGRADRFISYQNESVIVGPRGKKDIVKKSITDLQIAIAAEQQPKMKEELKKRMARLSNKIGVIKVGAATDNEVNALKYKVDDSVNATLAAFKGGVVCGGGIALSRIKTSSAILNAALQAPFKQLLDNTGVKQTRELHADEAINVVTGEYGNFEKIGVMDPVDVLIAGIESAVSIASILVTTSGIIVEPPKEIKSE